MERLSAETIENIRNSDIIEILACKLNDEISHHEVTIIEHIKTLEDDKKRILGQAQKMVDEAMAETSKERARKNKLLEIINNDPTLDYRGIMPLYEEFLKAERKKRKKKQHKSQ